LKALSLSLIDDDTAWRAPLTKIRTPEEFLIAMSRDRLSAARSRTCTVAGLAASRETREAVSRAESHQQALAILFMSPEFQRR
jgi:uncharacterized protein (DUF1800 family)